MVTCLERSANDLHMVQLMPLPPHHLGFSKIQNGLSFWYRPTQVVLEKRPLNDCGVVVVLSTGKEGTEYYERQHTKYSLRNIVSHTQPSRYQTWVCSYCTVNTCRNPPPATATSHNTSPIISVLTDVLHVIWS